nr:hypothetical protein [uncultured Campylobacter sp.]
MAKQISELPTAPSTQRSARFNTEANAFVAALEPFRDQANALAEEAETNAQRSEDASATAQSAKDAAQASAQTASEAKEAAARSASEAESSAQAAEQIKTQTQEIKQSAQEALAIIAAAAQSSAQAARQSEQAAEQTKTELQTATQALQDMKSIVKDGFIDDTAQSETKTYSSKKIVELNEALSADITQELDQTGKEIRTAAMSGAMPSAYESDLAMWDYMEQSRAGWADNIRARFFKDWALGLDKAIGFYTVYPNLDNRIKNNYYVSSSERITAILDGAGEVIAAIVNNGTIYKRDGTTTYLNTTNPDGVSISASNKVDSVAGKFVLFRLNGDGVAVFGLSGDDKVLKYLYKTSVADISSSYVFHDVLVINKYKAPLKTYKITNTGISEITGVGLPARNPEYSNSETYMPFYKDFLLSKNALIKADGTVKSIRIYGEILGFLGGTPYLLQRAYPVSGTGGRAWVIYDVESGNRGVLLSPNKKPLSAYVEDGYTYIVFADGVTKIPAKYLTGANYKGE